MHEQNLLLSGYITTKFEKIERITYEIGSLVTYSKR